MSSDSKSERILLSVSRNRTFADSSSILKDSPPTENSQVAVLIDSEAALAWYHFCSCPLKVLLIWITIAIKKNKTQRIAPTFSPGPDVGIKAVTEASASNTKELPVAQKKYF